MNPGYLTDMLWAGLHKLIYLLICLAVHHLCKAIEAKAAQIKDERLRSWAETLVHSAEERFSSQGQGASKKDWVVKELQRLFPSLSYLTISAVVDGVLNLNPPSRR